MSSAAVAEQDQATQQCAPAAAAAEGGVRTAREAGSGLATGRVAACDHAINTKGTGASGNRAAAGPDSRDCDDDNDGAADRTALAIKTKGTSAQRTVAAGDLDQDGALDVARSGPSGQVSEAGSPSYRGEACGMAIKTKGTGAQ